MEKKEALKSSHTEKTYLHLHGDFSTESSDRFRCLEALLQPSLLGKNH